VLINLPDTTAAEDSDEDAEHVTGVDRSPADDELQLGCVLHPLHHNPEHITV